MPALYHFSEEPDIAVFAPRALPARPEITEPLVWAIDAAHQHMYLFPRDCPRALLWPVIPAISAAMTFSKGEPFVR